MHPARAGEAHDRHLRGRPPVVRQEGAVHGARARRHLWVGRRDAQPLRSAGLQTAHQAGESKERRKRKIRERNEQHRLSQKTTSTLSSAAAAVDELGDRSTKTTKTSSYKRQRSSRATASSAAVDEATTQATTTANVTATTAGVTDKMSHDPWRRRPNSGVSPQYVLSAGRMGTWKQE